MKNLKCKVLALCMGASVFMCEKAFSQVPSYVPTNGLVGWWPFNGNANDESGNGNNGTVNGATLASDRNGVADRAYSLDGINDWIETNSSFLQTNNPHSISIWWQTSDSTKTNQTIFNTNPHTLENLAYHYSSSSSIPPFGLSIGLGNGGSWNVIWPDTCQITTPSNTENWHLATWVKDGTYNWKIYLDTTLLYTFNSSINIGSQIANIRFGAENNGFPTGGANLIGKLDDIGIWNRALTPQEITDLYNGCTGNGISLQPANVSTSAGTNAQFIVNATSGSSFQWQTDLGLGFQNLSNAGQYSGATNDTLWVSNVSSANNNQQFRCIVNSASCADTSYIAVLSVSTVGINELSVQGNVSLYPNPTQSSFEIQTNLVYSKVEIRDMQGRIVKTENAAKTINLSSLQKGTYSVNLLDEHENTLAVRKIVLQ